MKIQNIVRGQIIKELHKILNGFGAESDLLCITGSFDDTMNDQEILTELQVWQKKNKWRCPKCNKGHTEWHEAMNCCRTGGNTK